MAKPRNSIIGYFVIVLCFVNGRMAAQKFRDYPIQPVNFTHVQLQDNFWSPKIKVNQDVTIPYTLAQCKKNGRIDNFLRAAGKLKDDKHTSFPFDDTDLYKVIEGASYSLQSRPNPSLAKYLDSLIAIIGAAQEKDGYLYTFRTMHNSKPHEWIGEHRWINEEDLSHELYNAGHLYESAVAHYQATGKKNLLEIAIKNANLLVRTFGPGREEKFPGHQIVETGLTKLYRVTGNKEYLNLAKFFLDLRGRPGHNNQVYSQSDKKVVDQHTAEGHAVRAAYMYTGMADVAALTGDKDYLSAIDDIWNDVANHKVYITGGIGATGNGEAFGDAYDLPNMSAYAETCAAIANVYWNQRMFLLHGDAKYIDMLERTLYNGLLSGISLSGDRFFYPNPLASLGQHQRQPWWDCACCVSNITRFLPSMPGYVYAQNKNNLYVNLFVGSSSVLNLPATNVHIIQKTEYPWAGNDEITINPAIPSTFNIYLRIPGWLRKEGADSNLYTGYQNKSFPTISINGRSIQYRLEKGYAIIKRHWKKGDKISLTMPMNIQKVYANGSVKANINRFALQRGPIVYCLESPDNVDSTVMNIVVDSSTLVTSEFEPNLLSGVTVLQMAGQATKRMLQSDSLSLTRQKVTAIPYFAWANRGPSEMEVWISDDIKTAHPKPAPTIASRSKVSASVNNPRMFRAVNDQYEPADSKDGSASYLHWWPKKNTTEWVQYDFDSVYTVSTAKVYWFDDSPWGGCRIPSSWRVLYSKDGQWLPVTNTTPYSITKDAYDSVHFQPVATNALRLEVQLPVDFASGIHEWIVK